MKLSSQICASLIYTLCFYVVRKKTTRKKEARIGFKKGKDLNIFLFLCRSEDRRRTRPVTTKGPKGSQKNDRWWDTGRISRRTSY